MLILNTDPSEFDISSEIEVARATFNQDDTQLSVVRICLSGATVGEQYTARVYLNDFVLVPEARIVATAADVAFQSRDFLMNPSDVVTVTVEGAAGDTAVTIFATICTVGFNYEELLTAISALTVRPERTVLGPCKKTVAKIMGNCK